jgi:CheY-like chemotaxis protein
VKNFLAMVRQRSPERTRVCLNEVVKAVMDLLAYPLRVDNIDVSLQLADHLPILCADPHQFQQVVVNLITNAHQAMQETPLPRRLTLTTWADLATSRVHLTVADTGPGIPAALQARIFEPFFTTKPPGVGTGLGLSLCQGIIESHGGTMRVESAPGCGAVFQIECPVGAVPMPVPAALPVETLVQMPERSILVVDDEPGITGALAYLLDRDGHQVETAANGRIALERLQERDYDLLLSDLRMPELDGLGLYKELEHHHPHMLARMVFLTGDTLSPETMDLLDTMGAPRLNKPFTAAEVRRVVQRALMEQVTIEPEG